MSKKRHRGGRKAKVDTDGLFLPGTGGYELPTGVSASSKTSWCYCAFGCGHVCQQKTVRRVLHIRKCPFMSRMEMPAGLDAAKAKLWQKARRIITDEARSMDASLLSFAAPEDGERPGKKARRTPITQMREAFLMWMVTKGLPFSVLEGPTGRRFFDSVKRLKYGSYSAAAGAVRDCVALTGDVPPSRHWVAGPDSGLKDLRTTMDMKLAQQCAEAVAAGESTQLVADAWSSAPGEPQLLSVTATTGRAVAVRRQMVWPPANGPAER